MARKCTCQICKNKGTTEAFYKVTDEKGKSKYYCNKEEYDNMISERNKRTELLKYIAIEVLNYEEDQIVPPVITKKIKEMNSFYDYEVIHECFKMNKETIQYWITNKNFDSEYGMASYIMRIIENNINDVYNKWKHSKKTEQKQENNSLDLEMINEINNNHKIERDNGILDFLDEEDV